jgi:hypothetical protein
MGIASSASIAMAVSAGHSTEPGNQYFCVSAAA